MKLLKNILKVTIIYTICLVLVYSLAIRLRNAYEEKETIVQEYNYEEYYAYDYE